MRSLPFKNSVTTVNMKDHTLDIIKAKPAFNDTGRGITTHSF
jgi:hypothetical protein